MSRTLGTGIDHALEIDLPLAGHLPMTTEVSFAEEEVWLAAHGGAAAVPFLDCRSTMLMAARLESALDLAALAASLNEIVSRHEVLRSAFDLMDGQLVRHYEPSAAVTLAEIDLRNVPDADRSARLQEVLVEERRAPFDLACPPLLRAVLVKLRTDEHVLALAVPHIVFDRWSKRVFAQELTALYSARVTGSTGDLEPLAVQYRDYVRWQRERLTGSRGRILLQYWRQQLSVPEDVHIPCDGDRTQVSSTRSATWSFTIAADDVARLGEVSRRLRVTMATLMFAIGRVFIHSVGGEGNVAIGVPLTDRRRQEFEALIGLFMNVVVVRTTTLDSMTFADVLDGVRRALVDASRHQDMPHKHLLRAIPAAKPLYRILFSFMPGLQGSVAQLPGVRVTPLWVDSDEPSIADMTVQMVGVSGALICRILYKAELFSPARVRGFGERLQSVVDNVLDGSPEKPIGTLRAA